VIFDRVDGVVLVRADGVQGGPLRDLSDRVRQQEKADGAIVSSIADSRAFLVVNLDESLVARGLDASALVRELSPQIGGRGGGKPTFAQAGGDVPGGAESVLVHGKRLVEEALS